MKIRITVTRENGGIVAEDELEAVPPDDGPGTIDRITKTIEVGIPGQMEEVEVAVEFDPPATFT